MTVKIEIAEAHEQNGRLHLVAEVNRYQGKERVEQLSRTPFEFDATGDLKEIKATVRRELAGYLQPTGREVAVPKGRKVRDDLLGSL